MLSARCFSPYVRLVAITLPQGCYFIFLKTNNIERKRKPRAYMKKYPFRVLETGNQTHYFRRSKTYCHTGTREYLCTWCDLRALSFKLSAPPRPHVPCAVTSRIFHIYAYHVQELKCHVMRIT